MLWCKIKVFTSTDRASRTEHLVFDCFCTLQVLVCNVRPFRGQITQKARGSTLGPDEVCVHVGEDFRYVRDRLLFRGISSGRSGVECVAAVQCRKVGRVTQCRRSALLWLREVEAKER